MYLDVGGHVWYELHSLPIKFGYILVEQLCTKHASPVELGSLWEALAKPCAIMKQCQAILLSPCLRCVPDRPPCMWLLTWTVASECVGRAVGGIPCLCVSEFQCVHEVCWLAWTCMCLFVTLTVCVVLWWWELTGSERRCSLIQCFEMSPPAVVGLRGCSLGGGLQMMRCFFYLHSSRIFLPSFFASFIPSFLLCILPSFLSSFISLLPDVL